MFSRVALIVFGCAAPAAAIAASFPINMRMGDTGIYVASLQQVLNASQDTQVAATGPGSPGQETAYFGQKTFEAVKKFQAKYYNEVLAPGGLTSPTGFVGPATRAQLEKVSASPAGTSSISSIPNYTPAKPVSAPAPVVSSTDVYDSGLKKLPSVDESNELYIAGVKREMKAYGQSDDEIAAVEREIRKIIPDAQKTLDKFYEQEQEFFKSMKQAKIDSPVMDAIKTSLSTVRTFFVGETAHASALGLPVGGWVATLVPVCTCTPLITQMLVFLPGPNFTTSNMNLDYAFGTMTFNWHNLPLPGIGTVADYAPITPSCWIYVGTACIPVPSRGLLTPLAGSSLLPTH